MTSRGPHRVGGAQPRHVPARRRAGLGVGDPERHDAQPRVGGERRAHPLDRVGRSGSQPSSSRKSTSSPVVARQPTLRPAGMPTFSRQPRAARTPVGQPRARRPRCRPPRLSTGSPCCVSARLAIARASSTGRSPCQDDAADERSAALTSQPSREPPDSRMLTRCSTAMRRGDRRASATASTCGAEQVAGGRVDDRRRPAAGSEDSRAPVSWWTLSTWAARRAAPSAALRGSTAASSRRRGRPDRTPGHVDQVGLGLDQHGAQRRRPTPASTSRRAAGRRPGSRTPTAARPRPGSGRPGPGRPR